jgi:hypothetical protein
VVVAEGYSATVLTRMGDPVKSGIPAYANDGTDTDFANRIGEHGDALYYYGMSAAGTFEPNNSARGLLVQNHEALTEVFLHPVGTNFSRSNGNRRVSAQVLKEVEAHGVSVVEVARGATGNGVRVNLDGGKNRRVTARTPMVLSGPVAGDARVRHKPYTANGGTFGDGINVQGTLNNCANGYTPWGTYLTVEENWAGYFFRNKSDQARREDIERYGMRTINATGSATQDFVGFQGLNWDLSDGNEDEYKRFDCTATAADATGDFRNAPNTFGYVVEMDPFNPTAAIKKRTALGRRAGEGAWPAPAKAGKPVVFYLGDDSRFEYWYKFVSTANWNPADLGGGMAVGDKYLDSGRLYAAKFNADGSGEWIELAPGKNGLSASNGFGTMADICLVTRRAADIAGATNMDRPEWAAVDPTTGEVFLACTNNSGRGNGQATEMPEIYKGGQDIEPDAANPRVGNAHGHIIRLREAGDDSAATSFRWEVMVFGSRADNAGTNLSGLDSSNDFSSPDGLWMDPRGLLWIQTDDGSNYTNGSTALSNNQMLVTMPGSMGQTPQIRRFFVGPKGCEITGVDITPDGKTMFVGVQHPGEIVGGSLNPNFNLANPATYQSHWPVGGEGSNATTDAGSATSRPRSAVVVVTKNDGGIIGM